MPDDDATGASAEPLSAHPPARPARAVAAVVVLTLLGAALRLVQARQDLFADELATYWIVTDHGLRGVLDTVSSTAEITPPLSFVLSWLTAQVSHSAFMIRLPAFIAGVATVPMVWNLGRRTLRRDAALLATVLTTLSPFMILYSAEARGYGVLMALLVGSTLAMVKALDGDGARWWVIYALCVCLSMYTHYTSVFVIGGQALWALWRSPERRRATVLATAGAGVLFLPWLPGLKGDMDSPTTQILSAFSPLSTEMVRRTLGHWSVGFPYAFPSTSLSDLPGRIPMLMLLAGLGLGIAGAVGSRRAPLARPGAAAGDQARGGVVLVVLLALATPVGTLIQSAASTNVFSVRSLGASWPYLALAVSALVLAAAPPLRPLAAGLVIVPFAIAAATMLGPDFQRPAYGPFTQFADDHDAAVVVNGAAFPPGPLTQLDVEATRPAAPVLRLFTPEQKDRPFGIADVVPESAAQMRRAVEIAAGGNIVVIYIDIYRDAIDDLLETLPDGYAVTAALEANALYLFDLRAVVLERADDG